MIGLSKLLWADEELVTPHAISDILGDCYLCANNPMFFRMRELAIDLGITYSCRPEAFWTDYNAASLLALTGILDRRVVPYISNAVTLRRIAGQKPELQIPGELFPNIIRRNFVLHESAHCVADQFFNRVRNERTRLAEGAWFTLLSLLAESYANSAERLGAAFAVSPTHRLFYAMNSYMEPGGAPSEMIAEAMEALGIAETMLVGAMAFYYLNTQEGPLPRETRQIVLDALCTRLRPSQTEKSLIRMMLVGTFDISNKFRSLTTPLFFRFCDCEAEFGELCNSRLDNVETVCEMLNELITMTWAGVRVTASPGARRETEYVSPSSSTDRVA